MIEIIMPIKHQNMDSGQIVDWKIEEGEIVRKGDIIFAFESDKVIYEVEAPEAGMLGRKFSFEGEKVPVGTLVAYLAPVVPDPSTE